MRFTLPLALCVACATARPHIADLLEAPRIENGRLETDHRIPIGSRWELIDDRGALGDFVVLAELPGGGCYDAVCIQWTVRFRTPPIRTPHDVWRVAVGPIDRPLERARVIFPEVPDPAPGELAAPVVGPLAGGTRNVLKVDLDGDGKSDLELYVTECNGPVSSITPPCRELRERTAAGWHVVWLRDH